MLNSVFQNKNLDKILSIHLTDNLLYHLSQTNKYYQSYYGEEFWKSKGGLSYGEDFILLKKKFEGTFKILFQLYIRLVGLKDKLFVKTYDRPNPSTLYHLRILEINDPVYRINRIPKEINILTNIEVIYINYNGIEIIPKEISKLVRLRTLDLSHNLIKEIPVEIKKLNNLSLLKLDYNKIDEIPMEILQPGCMPFLDGLSLNNNNLTTIPNNIGNLVHLKFLYLNENKITRIPNEIGELEQLEILHLSYNQLTEIPKEIGNISNLKKLHLSDNKLTVLPKELGNNKKLMVLRLNYNPIKEIPKEISNTVTVEFIKFKYCFY